MVFYGRFLLQVAAALSISATGSGTVVALRPGGTATTTIAGTTGDTRRQPDVLSAWLDHVHEIRRIVASTNRRTTSDAASRYDSKDGDTRKLQVVSKPAYTPQSDGDNSVTTTSSLALQTICQAVQESFESPHDVSCTCEGATLDSFSISCQYATPVCHDDTCGVPQIAVSISSGNVFSATTCVAEYTRNEQPLLDTCVFVNACPQNGKSDIEDTTSFCDCTASYGGSICGACTVCDGGRSLSVDCANVNVEAVSSSQSSCTAIDLDWHLADGAGSLAGFAPVWDGFCSQLEASLNNTIVCDCTNAVGGTFALQCHTTEPVCVHDHTASLGHDESTAKVPNDDLAFCGSVSSTVNVVNGQMESVTACTTYEAPLGETCTALQQCPTSNDAEVGTQTDSQAICGCMATYNGIPCASCTVCDDQVSLTLDCSNVYEHAVTEQCQPVQNSYEFLPYYAKAQSLSSSSSSGGGLGFDTKRTSGSSHHGTLVSRTIWLLGMVLLLCVVP
jgi:hypothetical protein